MPVSRGVDGVPPRNASTIGVGLDERMILVGSGETSLEPSLRKKSDFPSDGVPGEGSGMTSRSVSSVLMGSFCRICSSSGFVLEKASEEEFVEDEDEVDMCFDFSR